MIELNLIAKNAKQQQVLDYLQENVSEVLAEKINKGVHVTVDGKELISVKDLSLFWDYAGEELKKTIPKQEQKGCVIVSTTNEDVFGMAIHYFEEDSILGKLFNLDGTEYKTEAQKTGTTTSVKTTPKKKNAPSDGQISIFDFNIEDNEQNEAATTTEEVDDIEDDQDEDEEQDDIENHEAVKEQVQHVTDNYSKVNPFYKKYCELKSEFIDSILFFRLGDFYELFGEDAVTAANILDLTLTSKDVGLPNRVALAGVPYHAIDTYVQKLSKKYNVIVYDNDNEKYLVMNGRHIDLVTGVVTNLGEATPEEETNPHIRYLQTLIDDLKVDL